MKFFSHSHRYAWFKMKSIKKKKKQKEYIDSNYQST
jgi:hypothetical protein